MKFLDLIVYGVVLSETSSISKILGQAQNSLQFLEFGGVIEDFIAGIIISVLFTFVYVFS